VTATSGHAELAYDVIDGGNGRGPAVLLLHAGAADRRSWRPVVEALGPRHATVAFDRRGFGETRYRPEPHSHVDDALAALDTVDSQARAAAPAKRMPYARLEVLPGTAHLPHLEGQPDCLAAITAFLSEI